MIGFYSLAVGDVSYDDAPERLRKGLARHPVPLMLLARLAVGEAWQGKGVGAGLLKDAMLRTNQAADIGGIRALAAHAKDGEARAFYEHFGFMASPSDPLHLFILTKELGRSSGIVRQPYGSVVSLTRPATCRPGPILLRTGNTPDRRNPSSFPINLVNSSPQWAQRSRHARPRSRRPRRCTTGYRLRTPGGRACA